MIDIENEIFTIILNTVRAVRGFSNITASSTTNYNPAEFPCFYLEQADNIPVIATQTTESNDNHETVVFEVNIYSKKKNGAKQEAKKIAAIIDGKFNELGFTRTTMQPFSLPDATGCRIFLRFRAVVGKDKTIYRR